MKLIKFIIIALVIILIIKSYPWIITAGGAGNISIYRISCDKMVFERKIDSLINTNSQIFIPTNPNYTLAGTGYEDTDKNIAVRDKNSTYIFRYSYSTIKMNWKTDSVFSIALTHVGKFNEPLREDSELFPFEDYTWENRFEKLLQACNFKYTKE
jgi:hypothetical protein